MGIVNIFVKLLIFICFSIVGVFYFSNDYYTKEPVPEIPTTNKNINPSLYKKLEDSVVNITIDSYEDSTFYGSGFVILYNEKEFIVTAHHVISEAKTITITNHEGKSSLTKVVGYNSKYDLAILTKPKELEIKPLVISNNMKLEIGNPVIAIGNPVGLMGTFTTGIISALDRNLTQEGKAYEEMIQTDAAFNPGNSGGPLINIHGEVIGINTAIMENYQGLGFAAPIKTLVKHLPELTGHIQEPIPFIGVILGEEKGDVLINKVLKNSPAEQSGVKIGDIILKVNNIRINRHEEVPYLIQQHKIGDTVELLVKQGGKEKLLKIKVTDKNKFVE